MRLFLRSTAFSLSRESRLCFDAPGPEAPAKTEVASKMETEIKTKEGATKLGTEGVRKAVKATEAGLEPFRKGRSMEEMTHQQEEKWEKNRESFYNSMRARGVPEDTIKLLQDNIFEADGTHASVKNAIATVYGIFAALRPTSGGRPAPNAEEAANKLDGDARQKHHEGLKKTTDGKAADVEAARKAGTLDISKINACLSAAETEEKYIAAENNEKFPEEHRKTLEPRRKQLETMKKTMNDLKAPLEKEQKDKKEASEKDRKDTLNKANALLLRKDFEETELNPDQKILRQRIAKLKAQLESSGTGEATEKQAKEKAAKSGTEDSQKLLTELQADLTSAETICKAIRKKWGHDYLRQNVNATAEGTEGTGADAVDRYSKQMGWTLMGDFMGMQWRESAGKWETGWWNGGRGPMNNDPGTMNFNYARYDQINARLRDINNNQAKPPATGL